MHRDFSSSQRDEGFTLVELLIVIVILGVLSSVTVYTVQGITSRGHSATSSADTQVFQRAEEAHMAQFGVYASEADLVTAGLMHDESTVHDVEVASDLKSYTLVGQGASSTTAPPAPWTDFDVQSTTFGGFSAEQYGNGPTIVLVVGRGIATQSDWDAFTSSTPVADIGDMRFINIVDPGLDTAAALTALIDTADFVVASDYDLIDSQVALDIATAHLGETAAPVNVASESWDWIAPGVQVLNDFLDYVANDYTP